ncbi:MAG: hypothetical protein FJZ56_02420 [Chlamydiae bacterium]|nr:hypothetical protein [Chlamydiota bacterium]
MYYSDFMAFSISRGGERITKFSTFTGVYIPSLLTMFGVVLFLKMGWIVSVTSFFESSLVISLTLIIALITALSIASIASNFSSHEESAYDMISNELGSGFGSMVGIPLYLAQTFTVCFCVLAVAESIFPLIPQIPMQLINVVVLIVFALIAYLSFGFAMKMQIWIFLILVCSLASFAMAYPPLDAKIMAKAVIKEPFWKIFAVFFPVAMGVECGLSMAEHLKTPSRSILIGSVGAVLTALVVFLFVARALFFSAPVEMLQNDLFVIAKLSKVQWVIHLSIWTLAAASAIGSLLSAPRTLQAIALDGLMFGFIAKQPKIASAITIFIALCAIYFFNLNVVGPALSMVLLAAYGLINLMAAFEEMMDNPSWRPSFRIPWGISLAGALISFSSMFMIDPLMTFAIITFSLVGWSLTKIFHVGKEKDDLRQALLFFLSRNIIYKLAEQSVSQRSWRPNFLLFTRSPTKFGNLHLFARELTKKHGFLTIASIFSTEQVLKQKEKDWARLIRNNLRSHRTKALVEVVSAKTSEEGMRHVIENYGIGPLVPNTILLGQNSTIYSDLIEFAFQEQRNILIFRDHPEERVYIPLEVDIWWDEDNRKNSNLMLLLAFMLKRSSLFKSSSFTLKAMASSESARSEKESYFKRLLEEGHIDIQSKVFLGNDMIPYAAKEGLTFLGMRTRDSGESKEEYETYYKEQLAATKELSMVIFTLSFEHEEVRSRIY